MQDNFNFLPQYALFLLNEKLSQIAKLYLDRAAEINFSLLKLLEGQSEAQKNQIIVSNYLSLLQALVNKKGKEHALQSIELWKSDKFPFVKKDQAGAADLVTAINIRKYTFIKLLRDYSTDLDVREQILIDLVEYYSYYFVKLMEAFGEIQEEKLIQEKEYSQAIIKNCIDGVSAFDLDWKVTEWNPAMERINHIRREDIIGKSFYELYPAYENSEEALASKKVFEGESVYLSDRQYKQREGWYEAYLVPLHNDKKEVIGALSITHDITQRKEAEIKVQEDQHFIQTLADTSPDVITVYDLEKQMNIYSSKQIYEILGYSPEKLNELVNKGVQGLVEVIHPEDLPTILTFLASYKTYTGNTARDLEYRIKDHTGNYRWILDRYNVFKRSAQGMPTQVIGVARDNTTRKMAEEELQEANYKLHETNEELLRTEELLKEANNELEERVQLRTAELVEKNKQLTRINADLDNFIYTASHDLKAPIANIEGTTNILSRKLNGKITAQEQELLAFSGESVARLKQTIHDLTDIARVQKDLDAQSESVNFKEVFKEVWKDYAHLVAEGKVEIKDSFMEKEIYFAKKNLKSILSNLLSNAIKYASPERPCRIALQTYREDDYIVLAISDNGLGIPDDQQNKLFQMFKRFHTHVEGTGIGLYIVKRIVENYEGHVRVKSKEGEGSTFYVYFKKENTVRASA